MVACLVAACGDAGDNSSYALAGPDTLAVRDMLALVGGLLGKRPSRLAMPFDAPQSLTPDQVYAVCAYVFYTPTR